MTTETNSYFGFELLNSLEADRIRQKDDIIVLFVHWYCVQNGFKCIGVGDSKTLDPLVDCGSELLPERWNEGPNYSLRYVKDSRLYILLGTKSDEDLLINLLRIDNNCVSSIQFPIASTVGCLRGPLDSLIPTHSAVLDKIRKELIEPVSASVAKEIATQTPNRSESTERRYDPDDDPLRVQPPHGVPRPPWNPEADPRNIGRSDLDPFSRGGGMIFNPFAPQRGIPNPLDPRGSGGLGIPGRLPPGARPPGARFDPFGPPDIDAHRLRDPDADHLPPPGYDDIFM